MSRFSRLMERPFDFYGGGGGGGSGRFCGEKKNPRTQFFQKKNIQDRVNSIIRFVLYANKKDRIVSQMKNISRPKNTSPPRPMKIKWSLPKGHMFILFFLTRLLIQIERDLIITNNKIALTSKAHRRFDHLEWSYRLKASRPWAFKRFITYMYLSLNQHPPRDWVESANNSFCGQPNLPR